MTRKIVLILLLTITTTYLTLFIPRTANATRLNIMGCEKSCEIVAAGFPLPYLYDGYTSPIGSLSLNPFIILLTNIDIFSILNFSINLLFWFTFFFLFYILLRTLLKKTKRQE